VSILPGCLLEFDPPRRPVHGWRSLYGKPPADFDHQSNRRPAGVRFTP
jgi:hypothetical protein